MLSNFRDLPSDVVRSEPTSPHLISLKHRISAESPGPFDLLEVIGSTNITDQFASLLAVSTRQLQVTDASVTSEPMSVTLTARCDLLGTSGETGTFRFILDQQNRIQLELKDYHLGTKSVAQLQAYGILPHDGVWDRLSNFTGLVLNLTTVERKLSIISDMGFSWSVLLGLSNVTPDLLLKPEFQVVAEPAGELVRSPGFTSSVNLENIFGHNLSFLGNITLSNTEIDGILKLKPDNPVTSIVPFDMNSIQIKELGFEAQYIFARESAPAKSLFAIGGKARLGRPPSSLPDDDRLDYTARLVMLDGLPKLMVISLDKSLDVGGFIAQCITGNSAAWPSSFIDLTFDEGSRIYYNNSDNDALPIPDDITKATTFTYKKGFNIDAKVQLRLIETLSLQFNLNILQNGETKQFTGFNASATLDNPIDLICFSLAGPRDEPSADPYVGGPKFQITTGETAKFEISSGINFLQESFALATMELRRPEGGGIQLAGTLESARNIIPFGPLKIELTYTRTKDEKNEFSIGWPEFVWAEEIINIVTEFKNFVSSINKGSNICDTLANIAVRCLADTSYTVKPSVSMTDAGLDFSLVVQCHLSVQGCKEPYATSELPKITISVPKNTTFSSLPNKLSQGILNAGPKFMENLVHDPVASAAFISMTFGTKAIEVTGALLCRKIIDAAEKAAIDAACSVVTEALAPYLAAGGAITAAVVAIYMAASTAGSPTKPNLTSATYQDEKIEVCWEEADCWKGAQCATSYILHLYLRDTELKPTSDLHQTKGTLSVEGLGTGDYTVRVEGVHKGIGADLKLLSDPKALRLEKLAPPTFRLAYESSFITAFDFRCSGASSFKVQFYDSRRQPIGGSEQSCNLGEFVTLPNVQPGQTYFATARAFETYKIPSDKSSYIQIQVVAQPASLTLNQNGRQLTGTWTAVSGATSYEFRLQANTWVIGRPTTGITSTSAMVELPSDFTENQISAQVRAIAPEQTGDWCNPVFITLLAMPQNMKLEYVDPIADMAVSWDAVENATSYEVQFTDNNGTLLPRQPQIAELSVQNNATRRQFPIPVNFFPVLGIKAQVRAKATNRISVWSELSEWLHGLRPPLVTALTAGEYGNELSVTLTRTIGIAQPTHYGGFELVDGVPTANDHGCVNNYPNRDPVTLTIPLDLQRTGTNFQVRVVAYLDNTGPWDDRTSTQVVKKLATPQLESPVFNGETLLVRLASAVEHAEHYYANLFRDDQGINWVEMMPTPADPYKRQASLPIPTDTDMGKEYKVQVYAMARGYITSCNVDSNPVRRLDAPEQEPLRYEPGKLVAKLANPVPSATSYKARLVIDETVREQEQMISPSTELEFHLPDDALGKKFQVELRAIADGFVPSIWKLSTDAIILLAAPEQEPLRYEAGKLIAKMVSPVKYATSYKVRLVRDGSVYGQEQSIHPSPSDPTPYLVEFPLADEEVGKAFQVEMCAIAEGCTPSIWKRSIDQLTPIDIPRNVRLAYLDADFIEVIWDRVANATDYNVQITDTAGIRLAHQPNHQGNITRCLFPNSTDFPSGGIKAQMQAVATNQITAWSGLSDVLRLMTPGQPMLLYEDGKLTAKLANPVSYATGYEARLVMDRNLLGPTVMMQQIPNQVAGQPTYEVVFSVPNDAVGKKFQVELRAIATGCFSSIWVRSNDLTLIGIPQNVELDYVDQTNVIEVIWDRVANATGYNLQITDTAGTPLAHQPNLTFSSQGNIENCQFPNSNEIPAGGIKARVQATAPNQITVWSGFSQALSRQLAAPDLSLAYVDGQMVVSLMTSVPNAKRYEARLVIDQIAQDLTQSRLNSNHQVKFSLPKGKVCQAEMRAIANGFDSSIWKRSSQSMFQLAAPELFPLRYEPGMWRFDLGKLIVTLASRASSPDPQRPVVYQAQLVVDGIGVGDWQTIPPHLEVELSLPRNVVGRKIQVEVRMCVDNPPGHVFQIFGTVSRSTDSLTVSAPS